MAKERSLQKGGQQQARSEGASSKRLAEVLVIDDDPAMGRLIERMLKGSCKTRTATKAPRSGELDIDGVDLIILDYQMPGRDGLDVLKEIRSLGVSTPVLFLTAFGSPDLVEEAIRTGADEFLTKPVDAERLRRVVEQLLDPSESRQSGAGVHRGAEGLAAPGLGEVAETAQSREFYASTLSGRSIRGDLVRFSPNMVVVETSAVPGVHGGDSLHEIRLQFGRQRMRSFQAVVAGVSQVSPERWQMNARLQGFWSVEEEEADGQGEARQAEPDPQPTLEDGTAARDEARRCLPAEFRLATHELAELLEEVQGWCAAAASRRPWHEDKLERFRRESRFVLETADRYRAAFWEAIRAFEKASETLVAGGGDSLRAAKRFARRELYPSVLSSPFLARIVERPIGVPGDYGMLGQILGNPLEGYSPYDRVLNSWILESGAADAYRYRVALLEREIRRSVAVCRAEAPGGRAAKVLSMASGVAYEVQHYVRLPESAGEADFTLVDFSQDTLDEACRQFAFHGELPANVRLDLHQSSVIDLANRSRGVGGGSCGPIHSETFDYTYCAGLYDYLSDRLVSRVSSYLYTTIRPGGLLVLSNYTPANPLKGLMTVVLDWELIYRTESGFADLVSKALPEDAEIEFETDRTGSEVYALARKPAR